MPQRGKVTCPRAHSQNDAEQGFEPRPSDSKGPILSRWAVTTFGYFPESSELLSHPDPGQMGAGWLPQGSRVVSLGSVLNLGVGAHPGPLWPSQPPPNIPESLLSFQLLPPALRPKGHLAQKTEPSESPTWGAPMPPASPRCPRAIGPGRPGFQSQLSSYKTERALTEHIPSRSLSFSLSPIFSFPICKMGTRTLQTSA